MVKKPSATVQRTVNTPIGPIDYALTKKAIFNLNMRITPTGNIKLSVPLNCPDERADKMILDRIDWITEVRGRVQLNKRWELPPEPDAKRCREILSAAVMRVYPLAASHGVGMPELKLRRMKSQWGNCHWRQGYITLNTVLARCPEHLQDYVALHELVHFLHQNHGRGFCAVMDALMPDWRERRRELYSYDFALEK